MGVVLLLGKVGLGGWCGIGGWINLLEFFQGCVACDSNRNSFGALGSNIVTLETKTCEEGLEEG